MGSGEFHLCVDDIERAKALLEIKLADPLISIDDAMIGANTNCVSCANATQARLTGKNIEAVASASQGYATPNGLLPSAPIGLRAGTTTVGKVIKEIAKEGDGAVGVVLIKQAGTEVEHVINVVNKGGEVYFIDSQIGKIVTLQPNLVLKIGRPL